MSKGNQNTMESKSVTIGDIFKADQVFTLPNMLSFLRLLLGGYIYYLMIHHRLQEVTVWIAIAIASDYLDGIVARAQHKISEMGKIIDPLADKVCIGLASIALYQEYGLPLWLVLLIILRDVGILVGSVMLISRLKFVVPSALPGKITVTVISATLLAFLYGIQPLQQPLVWLTLVMLFYSAGYYLKSAWEMWRKTEKNDR